MAYPTSIDSFSNPVGTTSLATDDHALQHRTAGSAIVSLENKMGIGAGSAAINQILIGSGAGTTAWGTIWNNANLGTPAITGGTINTAVFGTPAITGGTITSGTINSPVISTPTMNWDGWVPVSASLTYGTTDGHTFVVNSNVDLSGTIGVGDKMKATNNSTTFYGLVTAIASGSITLYGGTNYTLVNSAITSPSYSHLETPYGFVHDPSIWTERSSGTASQTQTNPVAGTWYNPGTVSLSLPIGKWVVRWSASLQAFSNAAVTIVDVAATLSTANNSETDQDLSADYLLNGASFALNSVVSMFRQKSISVSSKTTYYLNITSPNGIANGGIRLSAGAGGSGNIVIEALSAYF